MRRFLLSNYSLEPIKRSSNLLTLPRTPKLNNELPDVVVLKIGGEVATDYADQLVEQIETLRSISVRPVLVHGAGPQLNRRLSDAGIEPEYVDGMRVTDEDTLKIAREVFNETNELLTSKIPNSKGVVSGVFKSELLDFETWKHVGDVKRVDTTEIENIIRSDRIPVVTCMGENEDGSEFLNINADVAAVEMSRNLDDASKLVFVSAAGGLKDARTNEIIDTIDLSTEFESYMAMDWVKYGTRLKLKQFQQLLSSSSAKVDEIFVTSPDKIVQSTRSTMRDNDEDEEYSLKFTQSPGTVVYRSFEPSEGNVEQQQQQQQDQPKTYRVGLLGARGYVGRELLQLLDMHSNFNVEVCVSRSLNDVPVTSMLPDAKNIRHVKFTSAGSDDPKKLKELYGNQVDVWVLAMPNNVAEPFVKELQSESQLLIDLSADYRFDDTWTYGLPERQGGRDKIRGAKLVSNPGCYATGAQVALMPLADSNLLQQAQVFGVSGYSGAGTSPSDKNDVKYLTDNIVPYVSLFLFCMFLSFMTYCLII
jgi:N-acetyl-gamma-glutamyl-phosphate reductase / acetylglutamate kinase